MSRPTGALATAAGVLALSLVSGLGTPVRAEDHMHVAGAGPTAQQLAQPAVVRVETGARLDVVVHSFKLYIKSYQVSALATGSGFLADRSGTVVTAASAVRPISEVAETYGINRAFHDLFGLPLAVNPYRRTTSRDPALNTLLQSCYGVIAAHDNCKVFVTPVYRVYPFVVDPGSGVLAQPLGGITPGSQLAFLTTNVRNSPTESISDLPLSSGAHANADFVAIGFPARPLARGATNPALVTGKLASGKISPADASKLTHALGSGLAGTVLADAVDGDVLGLLAQRGHALEIVAGPAISSALAARGADTRRSEVDTAYATALDHYDIEHYSASVSDFARVLELSNGHALATQYYQEAKAKAGGKDDLTNTADDGMMTPTLANGGRTGTSRLAVGGAVLLALLLAFVAWFLRARTHRAPLTADVTGSPETGGSTASRAAVSDSVHLGSPVPAEATIALARMTTPARESVAAVPARAAVAPQTAMRHRPPAVASVLRRHCTQCGDGLGAAHRFCASCGEPVG